MAQQKIELRKVRDFSDNLNDTFHFLKQNFKPLLTYVLGIAGVFMVTAAILNGMYQSESVGMFREIFRGRESGANYEIFSELYFFVLLFMWLTGTALQVVTISYMKVYDDNGQATPSFEAVWQLFKKFFVLIAFYNIPLLILISIGSVLCLAPGIYLGVVLAIFSSIIINEDESFSGAFNRCFTLIKDSFWMSLGIYLIVMLISYFGSAIILLVVGIVTGVISYFTTENVTSTVAIVTSVLNIFSFVFYLLLFLSFNLNYFNLTERYDGTGILKKLEGLGTDKPPTGYHQNLEEEY